MFIFITCFIFFVVLIFFINYYDYKKINLLNNEGFQNSNRTIVLMGDSIIKNNAYSSDGRGIDDILIERTNNNTFCYAKDNAKIVDIYRQIGEIPIELNSVKTTIFISAGGNDILSYYNENSNDDETTSFVKMVFSYYTKLIKNIHTKLPNSQIILLDIYYPNSIKYKQYHYIIKEWNWMIYNYATQNNNNITGVIKISNLLTQSEDFTLSIEPSSIGGTKIADAILNYYNNTII